MKLAIVEDEAVHGKLLEQYIEEWAEQRRKCCKNILKVRRKSFMIGVIHNINELIHAILVKELRKCVILYLLERLLQIYC